LFVLVAGPLHTVRAEHRGSALAEQMNSNAAEILAVTRACFDQYLRLFDQPYSFGGYDQAFVPGLNWGAVETPGCVTLREELLFRSAVTQTQRQARAVVIAHEMAHMWFGDLVTMHWWDDLWLSESFAEYMVSGSPPKQRGSPGPGATSLSRPRRGAMTARFAAAPARGRPVRPGPD